MEAAKNGSRPGETSRSSDVTDVSQPATASPHGFEERESLTSSVAPNKLKPVDLSLLLALSAGWLVGFLHLPLMLLCILLYLAWHQSRHKRIQLPSEAFPRPRQPNKLVSRKGVDLVSDFEECEWLSQVLGQVWSFYRTAWTDWVKESLTTSLNWYKPDFIQDFRVDTVDLGQQPHFELIQRHPGMPANIIQLDVRTRQTDGLDIGLSAKLSMGMRVPLALQLKSVVGDIAITIRLSHTWPYTATISLRFLEKPDHKLVIKGLAGRFDLSQVPLLSTWLRQQVDVAISSWLVENPIEFPLKQWYNPDASPTPVRTSETDELEQDDELVASTAAAPPFPFSHGGGGCVASDEPGCSGPAALLEVQLLEAADLPGSRTPYGVVELLGDDYKVRTSFQSQRCEDKKSADCPWWSETFSILVPETEHHTLRVAVYNANVMSKPLLGQAYLPISKLVSTYSSGPPLFAWHSLIGPKGAPAGRVRLGISAQLLDRLDGPPTFNGQFCAPGTEEEAPNAEEGTLLDVLYVRLVQAEINKKAFSLSPDSKCRASCGSASWESKLVKSSFTPVFQEVHDFLLPPTSGSERDLVLQLLNKNLARSDDVIGSCRLEWPQLAACSVAAKNVWLDLVGTKTGSVTGRINVVVRVIQFRHMHKTTQA